MKMKKINLKVQGMTCSSCEVLIERGLKKVPGVENVKVSRAKECAEVECSENVSITELQSAVKEKGYTLSLSNDPIENTPANSFMVKDKGRWSEIGSVVIIMIGAYILLRQLNLLPQNLGVSDNMSYGFIFVIGLVAATSTCLAVAGGLLLTVATKFNEKYPNLTAAQKFKPHLYFNGGRIAGYTLLGGAIGALGSVLTLSPAVTGIITIIASLLMVVMGLQLLQIFPWLSKIQLKMPKFIAHKIYDAGNQGLPTKGSSFLFGAATFFLPCGFTQALQLYVLGKGDFATGALTMLVFSLGTLPALMSVSTFSSFAKGNFQRYFMTFSAVLIIILGIVNISSGATLTGAVISLPSGTVDTDFNPVLVEGKQVINLQVKGLDYFPDKFTLKKGIPVEWIIDGKAAEGCGQIITIPKLGITEQLSRDKTTTIEFTPQQTGKLTFTCGMGMAGPGVFEVMP